MSDWMFQGKPVYDLGDNIGFLYLIITPENRFYIGQCTHSWWIYYWGGGTDLARYYDKNGKKGVKRIILMFFKDYIKLDDAEKHLCSIVDVENNPKYYNLQGGGKSNPNITEQTKKLISEKMKARKLTDEHKRKISESNKGKIVSAETREKLSKINKGNVVSPEVRIKIANAHRGKKKSAEAKKNMSAKQKGSLNPASVLYEEVVSDILRVSLGPDNKRGYIKEMVDILGYSKGIIAEVIRREKWSHVRMPRKSLTMNQLRIKYNNPLFMED